MTTSTQTIQKGYKQTEIGVIPADWSVEKLGTLGEVIRGASPRPQGDKRYYGGNVPRLMVEDVTRDGKFVTPKVDFLTEEGAKLSRPCKKGTLTVVCSGTVGIPSFLAVDACIHDGFLALTHIKDKISDDYLYHQLFVLRNRFENSATHGGVFTNLTTEIFSEFLVAFPPTKTEQIAISETLSDVDTLIEKSEKLIEKKRNIKQGVMQELLTDKRRLPGFSGKWETKKLGEVAEFDHGRDLPKSDLSADGPYKCIHYGQLFSEYKELVSEIKSRTHSDTARFYSKANDVLMPTSDVTPRGLATASCIKEDGVILGGGILVIRLNSGYDGLYFSYFVSQNKNSVLRFVKGSTVFHLYANDIANFEVNFPELREQSAIASILSDMDTEIEKLESQLTKYQNLKQGMMQSLLTGKIRLLTQ